VQKVIAMRGRETGAVCVVIDVEDMVKISGVKVVVNYSVTSVEARRWRGLVAYRLGCVIGVEGKRTVQGFQNFYSLE
jgi:hypothetical protein